MTAGDEQDRVDATLAWAHRAHPEAAISALDRHSQPTDVPPALGFPADRRPPPGLPTGLAAVDPADRAAVVRAYERARSTGVAAVGARRIDGARVHVHFVDVREQHGVVLIVAVPDDGSLAPSGPDEVEDVAPRVTWVRLDGDATVLEVDDASAQMFGWSATEIVGSRPLRMLHPDDHGRVLDNWSEVLASPGEKRRVRARHLRADGSYLWVDITNHNRLDDPDHGDVHCEQVDVSDEMQVHEELAHREQLLRQLTDALPVGVAQFDGDRRTLLENEQLAAIVGATGLDGLLATVIDDDRPALAAALAAVADGDVPDPVEVHLVADRICRVALRPLSGGGGIVCVDDVTEEVVLRRELEARATFDALTACFNRSAILGALDEVGGHGPGTGVVFVDLDRFKPVNDEYGHAAGDELLAAVGDRLRAAVRDVDLVGRLGGDEFLVVCPGVPSAEAVEDIARRVAARLAEPMALAEQHLVRPRASIGVAWAPSGTDPAKLVALADAAMYESKRQSRNDAEAPTTLTISPVTITSA